MIQKLIKNMGWGVLLTERGKNGKRGVLSKEFGKHWIRGLQKCCSQLTRPSPASPTTLTIKNGNVVSCSRVYINIFT